MVESILSWTWVFGIFFLQNILEICRKSSSKPGDLLKELEQGSDWVYLRLKGSSWRSSMLMPLVDLSNFLTWFPFPCSCHKHPFHFQVPHVQYSNSKCPIFQQFLYAGFGSSGKAAMLVLQSSLSLWVSMYVSPMWEEKSCQSDMAWGPVNPRELRTLSRVMDARYLNIGDCIEERDISNCNEEKLIEEAGDIPTC